MEIPCFFKTSIFPLSFQATTFLFHGDFSSSLLAQIITTNSYAQTLLVIAVWKNFANCSSSTQYFRHSNVKKLEKHLNTDLD